MTMPDLKPELSNKSKYWIPKHRYYELKHYCLQYPHWQKLYVSLEFKMEVKNELSRNTDVGKPVEKIALIRVDCAKAMELVERTCRDASKELHGYLLKAVTEGIPYTRLLTVYQIPCGKDMYYDAYRKFFYILSQRRGI